LPRVRQAGGPRKNHLSGNCRQTTDEIENKMTIEWTKTQIDELVRLWNKGLPTSEIGRLLGTTKNAVVGKAHRLGLTKRQSPIKKKQEEKQVIRLKELRAGMCSWPHGEPGKPEFHFCGKPAVAGKPYCAEHCAMAYVSGKERKETTTEAA
jgi:GcrA cell cycle regulator